MEIEEGDRKRAITSGKVTVVDVQSAFMLYHIFLCVYDGSKNLI
jgi:hypothetical protein